jgi:hypothetical protein
VVQRFPGRGKSLRRTGQIGVMLKSGPPMLSMDSCRRSPSVYEDAWWPTLAVTPDHSGRNQVQPLTSTYTCVIQPTRMRCSLLHFWLSWPFFGGSQSVAIAVTVAMLMGSQSLVGSRANNKDKTIFLGML